MLLILLREKDNSGPQKSGFYEINERQLSVATPPKNHKLATSREFNRVIRFNANQHGGHFKTQGLTSNNEAVILKCR